MIAPSVGPIHQSEAEIFGMMVWLWMHSSTRWGAPIAALSGLMLPAIKNQQYVLLVENDRPVAYTAWAKLSAEREAAYVRDAYALQTEEDWNSGDRYWITDWIAPFGHTRALQHITRSRILPVQVARSFYHRARDHQPRVMSFHGIAVHPLEAKHWLETHPIVTHQG